MENIGIVLLIEDNEELNIANSRAIKLRGYHVLTAKTLNEARVILQWYKPDVILLDILLPDGNGFAFCEEIRSSVDAHIFFLTAKSEHEDLVKGLSAGGDDYITKPFHPEELISRIEAAMRRRQMNKMNQIKSQVIRRGKLTIDVVSLRALSRGKDLMLSPKEFALLLLLTQRAGEIVSTEEIYQKVWGKDPDEEKNAVQTIVSRLRKKLSKTCEITMFRGQGYMIDKEFKWDEKR